MADLERSVLDFYQIQTAYPDVWPETKNGGDSDSEGEDGSNTNVNGGSGGGGGVRVAADRERRAKLNRRKSRYQALERAATHRASTVPGGADKGVQRDEPDPLGTTDSVMVALKRNGLAAVQDDPKLRNRFLLSSTSFSPALFLSQVHTEASTEALVAGLDVLSRSIDQKSASLKVLVESNFERFVRAKATIDNVYKEMKYHGDDGSSTTSTPPGPGTAAAAAPAVPPRGSRTHSRHSSRNGFRSSVSTAAAVGAGGSGGGGGLGLASPGLGSPPAADAARKRNALVKESEYGVLGIKVPLLEVAAKAEDVWGPALGGREKEETLRVVSAELSRFRACVEASAAIADSIKRNDHETLVEEYHRARAFADKARAIVQQAAQRQQQKDQAAAAAAAADDEPPKAAHELTDDELYQVVLAARMWHDVEEQIQAYKREVWRKLTSMHSSVSARVGGGGGGAGGSLPGQLLPRDQQHMELISLLLELGVEDNPIWVWLLSRYDYLKGKIQAVCERTKIEIEVLRRRLAAADRPAPHAIAAHLRSIGRQAIEAKIGLLDAPDVLELWDAIYAFLAGLLASPGGILGEVVEFWQTVEGFVEGKTQKSLPTGYRGESQTHHRLSQQGAVDLQKGALELADLLREHVFSFFAGPPPEDISLLFSPIPLSPQSPMAATLGGSGGAVTNGALSPSALRDPRFNLDPKNPPPPSPRRGEAWEKFAFWPPWSNSVSGVHYLSKLLALVGSGASEMASIGRGGGGGVADASEVERLKALVGVVRERCVAALCAAWNKDAENVKFLEDWHRAADRRDVTRMPAAFAAFEGAILSGMQKILYVSEAMSKPGAGDIVLPPPTKLLQMVRAQYVTTLYKALSGMVENAERPVKRADDDWTTADADGLGAVAAVPSATAISSAVRLGSLADGRASLLMDNGAFNAGDRNVRMLLTLSNLQSLRAEVVPRLNTQFENAFSVKLTDETKTIRDVLGQIDTRLFLSYTRPSVEALRRIVRAGVLDAPPPALSAAAPGGGKPREARPYVYEALLLLVLVHSQVSTTAASLTQQVLSHLLEQLSRELLEAFKQQQKRPAGGSPSPSPSSSSSPSSASASASASAAQYDLAGLMQATLDVEFLAQTLSQYTTERASELQAQIYQELDARTDDDARARLQGELPEMRSVLKRLREASKSEFACFRKPKRGGGGGGGGTGGSSAAAAGGGGRTATASPAPSAGSGGQGMAM